MATYQWDSPYVGKYHATINGRRLEIERERGASIPRYKMYADKQYVGDYSQLNGAKTKLIKLATNQPSNLMKNRLPSQMPSKEEIRAGLEAAGYKVSSTDLDKTANAKVAVITRPSGLTVKMTPAEVLRVCAKHTKTGQTLLEETERTGEMPPVAADEAYIDDFGLDDSAPLYPPLVDQDDDQFYADSYDPEPEPQPEPRPIPQAASVPAVQSTAPAAPLFHPGLIQEHDCPPGMAYVQITGYLPVDFIKDAKATMELLKACGEFKGHIKMPTDLDF